MFDLTITFAGLCLLVPDGDKKMLHVLMPPTDATGHVHYPRLVFADQTGTGRCVDISGMHLELKNVASNGDFDPTMPAEVFDFNSGLMGTRWVERKLLEPVTPLPSEVRTRVRLARGRHGGTYRRGGFWNFKVGEVLVSRRLPTAVNWLVPDVNANELIIHDRASTKMFIIHPDAAGTIRLLIVHVTDEELKRIGPDIPLPKACPPPEHPGTHLKLFCSLLTPANGCTPPKFDEVRTQLAGVCPPVVDDAQPTSSIQASAGVAAWCAPATQTPSGAAPAQPATSPASAPAVNSAGHSGTDTHPDHSTHSGHRTAAAASAGSELTCMVATAPPGP
jgi:hypothetical protein